MELDPLIKKSWIEAQKRFAYPVNAIGLRIDPKDKRALDVWHKEGIDKYLSQASS